MANTGSGRRLAIAIDVAAVVDVLLMPPLRQKKAVTCLPRSCREICRSRSRMRCSLTDCPGFQRPPVVSYTKPRQPIRGRGSRRRIIGGSSGGSQSGSAV